MSPHVGDYEDCPVCLWPRRRLKWRAFWRGVFMFGLFGIEDVIADGHKLIREHYGLLPDTRSTG